MNWVALKMLTGDTTKYLGIVFGVSFAALLMAQQSARLMGAERVIAIDRFPERLQMAREHAGSETIDYTQVDSVLDVLKEAPVVGRVVAVLALVLEAEASNNQQLPTTHEARTPSAVSWVPCPLRTPTTRR